MNILRVATVAVLALLPLFARAEVSPVRIRVEQQTGNDSSKFTTTQKKSLKVFVSNSSKQELPGLKVKYFYFGRDLKSRDIKLLGKGEQPAAVAGLATMTVETPEASAKSTDKHSEGGNFGNSKSNRSSKNNKPAKIIEASGEKFVGYGVQVIDGSGKVLAEVFEPQNLKAEAAAR